MNCFWLEMWLCLWEDMLRPRRKQLRRGEE
jgi:hypothetical protein